MTQSEVASSDPFASPSESWLRVSPRLATVRRICVVAPIALLTAIGVGVLAVFSSLGFAALALVVGLGLCLWAWLVIGRQVRATSYALRHGRPVGR